MSEQNIDLTMAKIRGLVMQIESYLNLGQLFDAYRAADNLKHQAYNATRWLALHDEESAMSYGNGMIVTEKDGKERIIIGPL